MNLMIELYPSTAEGVIADRLDQVDHWDVLVRPDGEDPIEEHEGLTREEAEEMMTKMAAKYPEGAQDWQLEDLLH